MATQSDTAPLKELRLEELVRVLEIHNTESMERHKRFKEKLKALKQRQRELQQRRVTRLVKEGININIDTVKRRVKAKQRDKWVDNQAEREARNEVIKEKLRDLCPAEGEPIEQADSEFEYESETDVAVEYIQDEQLKAAAKKHAISMPAASSKKMVKAEDGLTPEDSEVHEGEDISIGLTKTVQLKMKKAGGKRPLRALGHVVSTTRYMTKLARKNTNTTTKKTTE